MPVSSTAAVPSPRLALAVEPDSATKFDPSPTIKLPLVTARPATSCSCASSLALATVPVRLAAGMPPVPVILLLLRSRLPPSCGLVSSTKSCIAESAVDPCAAVAKSDESKALTCERLVTSLSINAPAAVTFAVSVTSAEASIPFSLVWSASVKTLLSVALSTSVRISAAV